ncbi:MAG: hypothetical protein HYZ09_03430, partial [Candidatus Kerfeldbacteria bacterium]|nr:hypothetical protein [Candidatus Kerfeldbacteria bacterium]
MEAVGFVFGLIPIVGIAILAFFVIGFNNDAKQGGRGKGLFSAFTYSVAVVGLGLLVGSAIVLVSLGLKSTVLPQADYFFSSPPELFLMEDDGGPKVTVSECTDTCTFTTADKNNIRTWLNSYDQWRLTNRSGSTNLRGELASALAFFIVAAPLFFTFFRMLQREAARGQAIQGMRSFYFYGISVIGI